MKVNLIIGAGQLGSRHLQALLRLELDQEIYILDSSVDSLKVAQTRAQEIPNQHITHFITDWAELPVEFDLVIVATGANARSFIVKKLMDNYDVKNLILEKVLFQDLVSYEEIRSLLLEKGTPTWVNHPRRMFPHYQNIKKIISETNEKVVFSLVGSNWGLACNALHFIDLFAFLSNSTVENLNFDWIDDVIHESKRPGNIEFTGTVNGIFENKNIFSLSALDGQIGDISLYISTNSNRWIVQEGAAQNIIHMSKESGFKPMISTFENEFQSTLTTKLAKSIFETGSCALPSYKEACASHIPFITASLKKYVELTGIETNSCPIT
ncbi:Gfo/Idh/MocA family oxidoreductase [Pedobacter sp.]|uniref:Gfo/Idh/MocA family oxidoreductase n=1 Tax=Pedobacter sp. TaxID=1411316 RepID=UPI003BACEDA1